MMQIPKTYMDSYYRFWYEDGLKMRDILPTEVASMASDHWLDQPPSHPFINDLVGIFFGVLTIINLFGNGCTLYLYIKEPALRRPSNLLIINLAVSDMIMIISNGIPLTYNMFFENWWMFGKTWCVQYGLWGGITGLCSLWTLVFIGYDRYNTIVGGFSSKPFTNLKAILSILFCWGYPVSILIWPTLEMWSRWTLEGLMVSCSFEYNTDDWNNKSYTIFVFTCCYCVPLTAILYYYCFIVKAVWAHEAAMKAQAKKMNVESLRNDKADEESAEVKIAKVAVTNVVLWYLTWTPYATVVLLGQFGNRASLSPLVSQIPSMMTKCVSCLNPIVFAVSHPKFREAMKKHLPCCKGPEEVGNPTVASETKCVPA
eukprot:TRINITY_DN4816_c0_g1_i1.p1 TRINITY_DN4816_c0_g1~~TRINITY_DN4816_c0_g1_i1.p1  ORF type:complete len:371 (-),score=48.69 TRINITY_DN4816_c0_g1_i1:359-1471(-)